MYASLVDGGPTWRALLQKQSHGVGRPPVTGIVRALIVLHGLARIRPRAQAWCSREAGRTGSSWRQHALAHRRTHSSSISQENQVRRDKYHMPHVPPACPWASPAACMVPRLNRLSALAA